LNAVADRRRRIESVGYDYDAAAKEPVRECNLCGSSDNAEVARRDRYGFAAVLRLCDRCGLGFLSPRLTRAEYGRFYEQVYRPLVSAYHGRRIDSNTLQAEQRAYAAELLSFLEPLLDSAPRSVIDVGGSTGVVGGALGEAFGARLTVLDPSPAELAVAEANGMETIPGFVEDYSPGGRSWDLVLLCQTIDHLLDVRGALTAIAEMIAPGGHAFVDVLDVSLAADRCGSIGDAVKIDHPFYLTRETARAYFDKTGLVAEAERLSDDRHWGFVLSRGTVREPKWPALAAGRDRLRELASRPEPVG
jgi:2-polyprenyl-3-methyl-5-hydroxy-6-metoxy-1,4-benzoquinol methylase